MPLRIGLVGAGSMGSLHGRVIAAFDATELAWVADPDRAAGERVAERYGSKWLPEPEITGVDAVVIAAPNSTHARTVCACSAKATSIAGTGQP